MKHVRFVLVALVCSAFLEFVAGFAPPASIQAQTWEWAIKPIGYKGTSFKDNAVYGIDIDDAGSIFITGQFNDSASFSGEVMKSYDVVDPYLAKLTSSGTLDWVTTIGGWGEEERGVDITIDPLGNSYIITNVVDSLDFDGTIVRQTNQSLMSIAKFNSTGGVVWARPAAGIVSSFWGGIEYSPEDYLYFGAGQTFAKYTLDGDTVWTRQQPLNSNYFSINDIVVDKDGNYIYLTGHYGGLVDLGNGVQINSGSQFNYDIFVAKFDKDGTAIWAKGAGGSSAVYYDIGRGVDVDTSGNVYICGQFSETAYFDADSISAGAALWEMFVAKYNSSAELEWVLGGSSESSLSQGIASDVKVTAAQDAVIVGASFNSPVTFGGTEFVMPGGGGDALLCKIRSSGTLMWGQQSGSNSAIITVHGMEINKETSLAVVVGMHKSLPATFTPYMFATPPVGAADGFIVSADTDFLTPVRELAAPSLPTSFTLGQNYPNPFNPSTVISFDLAVPGQVNLAVFDLLGRKVKTLVDQQMGVGTFQVEWNGEDYNGDAVASGVYFYRLAAGSFSTSRKMLLLK